MTVIIVGAGIGGLATALSLHHVGIDCDVFESVDRIDALGVGINLLPHAVKELDALGLLDRLLAVALAPRTLAYFTKRGEEIWRESRGLDAGYRWPQISIHRGHLQRVLHDAVVARIGAARVHTGHHLSRFDLTADHAEAVFVGRDRRTEVAQVRGQALVAADGIHSQARRHARTLAGCLRCHGEDVERALAVYDERRRPATSRIVLANRGMGPERPMQLVEERAPDGLRGTALHDVISPEEILAVTEGYRTTAGFGVDELNRRPSLAELDY